MPDTPLVETPTAEAVVLFGDAFPRVDRFADLLSEEGELRGLIGPRELPRLWSRHIVNSAAAAAFLPDAGRVADIGSGAGFPGIVLASMRPDIEFTLVEPMERRMVWLEDVVRELALENVRVLRARAEELHGKERFDVVTARAVASLEKLVRWSLPLIRLGGSLVALKGERAGDEMEKAKYVLRKFGVVSTSIEQVSPDGVTEPTTVVVVSK